MAIRLRRAVRQADLVEALLSPISGAALGLSAVISAAAFVAGLRGLIAPNAWIAGLVAGAVWVLISAIGAGLFSRRMTPETARAILMESFGEDVGRQSDVARPVRAAVETRIRLAEAAEKAPAGLRSPVARIEAAADNLMTALVPLAQGLAAQKGGLQFHSGMASAAQQRSDGATPGLTRQIAASRALAEHTASETRRLEDAVAGFASVASELALHLARGQGLGLSDLARQAEDLVEAVRAPLPPAALKDARRESDNLSADPGGSP